MRSIPLCILFKTLRSPPDSRMSVTVWAELPIRRHAAMAVGDSWLVGSPVVSSCIT